MEAFDLLWFFVSLCFDYDEATSYLVLLVFIGN
jgi:hypothetical protein